MKKTLVNSLLALSLLSASSHNFAAQQAMPTEQNLIDSFQSEFLGLNRAQKIELIQQNLTALPHHNLQADAITTLQDAELDAIGSELSELIAKNLFQQQQAQVAMMKNMSEQELLQELSQLPKQQKVMLILEHLNNKITDDTFPEKQFNGLFNDAAKAHIKKIKNS